MAKSPLRKDDRDMTSDPEALARSVPAGEFPDGISPRNFVGSRAANPLPPLFLGAILLAGLAGLFGGKPDMTRRIDSADARLTVKAPTVIRNGMFFETLVEVRARRPVAQLVIAMSDPLWRQMTINTMIPAASEESYSDGAQRFTFARLDAGDTFRFKVDGQINPSLLIGNRGDITILDGERRLVSMPVTMKVLP
ncbi:hypothetical protein RLDS_14635 [Sphingobium lactosutens DS20]|uniref:Uncharacterized protein n=2 Tax=Sphingobium TaxID=165695 RepID=T0HMC3_9SPHN|nr:hypothetical protein RLDS_14635 [Sphingobium lactosutens DS20]